MAEVESQIANLLLEIAAQVKEWENRDVREAISRGDVHTRPAYFADLETIAAMLEGRHIEHKLVRQKPCRGRPGNPANVDRDLAVARLIDEYRRDPNLKVQDGIEAAMQKFGMSKSAVEGAEKRMRIALEPGNETIVPFFERLAARGLVKVSRVKPPAK